jgi:hypothetical protein
MQEFTIRNDLNRIRELANEIKTPPSGYSGERDEYRNKRLNEIIGRVCAIENMIGI